MTTVVRSLWRRMAGWLGCAVLLAQFTTAALHHHHHDEPLTEAHQFSVAPDDHDSADCGVCAVLAAAGQAIIPEVVPLPRTAGLGTRVLAPSVARVPSDTIAYGRPIPRGPPVS